MDDLNKLLDLSIDNLTDKLDGLSLEQLRQLRAAEEDGKTRVGALAAIDAAIDDVEPEPKQGGEAPPEGDKPETAQPPEVNDAAADEAKAASELAVVQAELADAHVERDAAIARAERAEADVADLRAAHEALIARERQATADANSLRQSLDGLDLATLEKLRLDEVNGPSRASVLDAIEAAKHRLAEAAKAAEHDPGSTVTKTAPTPASRDAAMTGQARLVFAEGDQIISAIAPQLIERSMFSISAGRPLLQRPIRFSRDTAPALVTHAMLLDADGAVTGTCEVPGGLPVGGGREAEIPAGSLIF